MIKMMISPKLIVIPIAVTVGLFIIFYSDEIMSQQPIQNKEVAKTQNQYIKEYSLPPETAPNAILADYNGIVWIIGSNSDLIKFDSITEQIESFYKIREDSEAKIGPLMAWTILKDDDGFLWFSRLGESKLWRFDTQIEEFRTFSTSAPAFQMKFDSQTKDIWFVTLSGNTVGVAQKNPDGIESKYTISEFWLGNNTNPTGLFVKNDKLWVTKISSSNEHGGAGNLSEYTIKRNENGMITNVIETSGIPYFVFEPTDVFITNDTIWFSEHGSSAIVKYDKNTKNLKRFPTSQNQYQTKTLPLWLKETADETGFWFNEHGGNRIGFFNTTSTKLTEYEIPSKPSDGFVVYPLNLSVDPQQNKVWFSEWNTDKIGVVDGSATVPFDVETDKKEILRDDNKPSQADKVLVTVSPKQNINTLVFLNATTSWNLLGMDYIRVDLTPNTINLKDANVAEMTIRHSVFATLNYTVATSASNGVITRTTFVGLNN